MPTLTPSIDVQRAGERMATRIDWLDSRHSFSFGQHYDPKNTHFGLLLVSNHDLIQPDTGFSTHPHRDMEIVSYVLEGGLQHRDSLGTGSVIRPGDVQRMSAGTGVTHSEFNASKSEPVHFLQIWLQPSQPGLAPGYEQKTFSDAEKQGRLCLVASPQPREGSLTIHSDAHLYAGRFAAGERAEHTLAPGRHAWVQVVRGSVRVNGTEAQTGDGIALSQEDRVQIEGLRDAEILLFDLA